MSWNEARRKLLELATSRHAPLSLTGPGSAAARNEVGAVLERTSAGGDAPRAAGETRSARAHSVCIASGKGGTGKSVVSAALAHQFSLRGRALIVDADLGVGNAHILQNVQPARSFVDVVEGEVPVRDVLARCSGDIDLLAAGSGVPRMAELGSYELHLIASGLAELELEYKTVVVDSAAGISRQTLAFARACDEVLVVTTPDLTAMTDAYAFLKVLTGRAPGCEPFLVVNRVRSEEEALEVAQRIGKVARRFLGRAPRPIGWIPEDPSVQACVNRRGAVTHLEPGAPAARALRILAADVLASFQGLAARGIGSALLAESRPV